jgi:hypothetical protein
VKNIYRIAAMSAIALLSIQTATLFVPGASASAASAATSQSKKKSKSKHKNRKEKILKGRHGKHKSRPA